MMESQEREQTADEKRTCLHRICKKRDPRFRKFVETTRIEGLRHVFTSSSIIRRIFWTLLVLTALGVALYSIVNRTLFLVRVPTATTVSLTRESNLVFPAVTICNLNLVSRSYLEDRGLDSNFADILSIADPEPDTNLTHCREILDASIRNDSLGLLADTSFRDVVYEGRQKREDFIYDCHFLGRRCNLTDEFVPVFTHLGYCYTFNSGRNGRPVLTTNGRGSRYGLHLILNISQDEYFYSLSFDAGVKIAVHPQSEPSEPDDIGIAVPPGRNAFISIQERRVDDRSSDRDDRCREPTDTQGFNFLREEYPYSTSACLTDCYLTNIAEECGCIEARTDYPPDTSQVSSLPDCKFNQTCCVIGEYYRAESCDCPSACNYIDYSVSTSYSAFPARYQVDFLMEELNITDPAYFEDNLLGVNVYFEDLNVKVETTENAYDPIALISDIGGQFGLFLGASILSLVHLIVYILDEIKDRCCGLSESKMKRKVRRWRLRKEENGAAESEEVLIHEEPNSASKELLNLVKSEEANASEVPFVQYEDSEQS